MASKEIDGVIRKLDLPSVIRDKLANSSDDFVKSFLELYESKKKSISTAYLLWLIGLHYVYLSKWGIWIIYFLTAGGFLIWWFVDVFRIPKLVRETNKDIAMKVLKDLNAIK